MSLLNGAGVKSGSALGEALGVSRMAVQKRIQNLVENGLPIIAVPGKGYELESGVQLLNAEDIIATCGSDGVESVEVLQSVDSTNSFLLQQKVNLQSAQVCVAESQEAGRGRRGNDWQSKPYRNIMLSISWGFGHWPQTITGLGLAVALIVSERLNERFGLNVQIKWPNDLLVGGNKLGGILIDVAGESSGECHVVLGLGLNVHQPDWSEGGDYQWVDLASLGASCDRNVLIGELVSDLVSMLREFEANGFAPLVERWNTLSSYAGKSVRVGLVPSGTAPDGGTQHENGNEFTEGLMAGVDKSGALLIDIADGSQTRFSDSSVSVRLLD